MPLKLPLAVPNIIDKVKPLLMPQQEAGALAKRMLGLNIGRSAIVGCELLHHGDEIVLEKCARHLLTDQPLDQQLKTFKQEAGFQAKHVNVSLKGQGVVVRFLTFPRMNRQDFASSLQFEAEKYLPFNIADVILDFCINEGPEVKGKGNTMPVILVAARKTEVNKLVQTVQGVGFQITAIDVDTFACANALEHAIPDVKQKSVGVIDFGARDTTFMIMNNGLLVFSRDIAFGGEDAASSIKKKLNVSAEKASEILSKSDFESPEIQDAVQEALERVFHEIKLTLNYYYNQKQDAKPLECIYIVGGFSLVPVLIPLLEKKVEVPIRKWNPAEGLKLGASVKEDEIKSLAAYLPVSIGLALRTK